MADLDLTTKNTNPINVDDSLHALLTKWTFWAHLPHDTDWSINSYKKITNISSVEELIVIMEMLPDKLIKNCMLFLMREGIQPTWEDPQNCNGGCFSYKVPNKDIPKCFEELCFLCAGNTTSLNSGFMDCITGVTLSPKKNFCILKLWMKNTRYLDPALINQNSILKNYACLFRRHNPVH
jgi:hypothetical protein